MQRVNSNGTRLWILCLFVHFQIAMLRNSDAACQDAQSPAGCSVREIEFIGQKVFSEKSLRRALNGDSQVAVFLQTQDASHDLDKFGKLICERLLVGYRFQGYVQAAATAKTNATTGKLQVTISEGDQQLRGAVRIEGASKDFADGLQAALTGNRNGKPVGGDLIMPGGPLDKRFAPVWKQGDDPGDLNSTIEKAKKTIRLWCEVQGFLFSEFDVLTEPSPDLKSVDLVVRIASLGSQLEISRVEFSGLNKHSEQEVRSFLNLPPALKYSEKSVREIIARLEDSGRFRSVQVHSETPFGPDHAVPLYFHVVESDHGAKLGEPLSDAEATMLRVHHWLTHWHESNENLHLDLTVQMPAPPSSGTSPSSASRFDLSQVLIEMGLGMPMRETIKATLDINSQGHVLGQLSSVDQDKKETPARRLYVNDNAFGLTSPGSPFCWNHARNLQGIHGAVSFEHDPNPDAEQKSRLNINFELRDGLPQAFDLRFTGPAAILFDLLHSDEIKVSYRQGDNGTATFEGEGVSVVVDRESGRVIQLQAEGETLELLMTSESGKYEQALQATQAELAKQKDQDIPSQMLISFCRYLIGEYAAILRSRGDSSEAALVESFVAGSPVEELLASLSNSASARTFVFPATQANATPQAPGLLEQLVPNLSVVRSELQQFFLPDTNPQPAAIPELQRAVTDTQIATSMEFGIKELEYPYAVIRYLIRVGQSMGEQEGERLATLIETGETFGSTKGINIRPYWRLLKSQATLPPDDVYHNLFPLVWSGVLKKHFNVTCTSLTGGGPDGTDPQFSWNFQFGTPPTPVKTASSSRVLPTESSESSAPSRVFNEIPMDKVPAPDTTRKAKFLNSLDPIEIPAPGTFKPEPKSTKPDGQKPFSN